MRQVCIVLALAVLMTSTSAGAEPVERVHLEYTARGVCPGREDFEARVHARTPRAQFTEETLATRVFDIRIEDGSPATGHVVVRRAGAVEGSRDVRAETCGDVADALALVLALAVDPDALLGAASRPTAPREAPPAEPESAASPPKAPAEPPPQPPPPERTPPEGPLLRSATAEPSPARASRPGALSLAMAVMASGGVAPSMLLGVSPRLGWTSSSPTLAGAVRVGVARATTGEIVVPGGSADFTWTVGQLDGCGVLFPREPARLAGCVHVESGALNALGIQVPAPRDQTRGWLGVGPLVRGEWAFLSPMFLEAEVAVIAHVLADRFYFLPDTTAYRVPIVGGYGSVGVGVFFL